jgi:hypothetical protein
MDAPMDESHSESGVPYRRYNLQCQGNERSLHTPSWFSYGASSSQEDLNKKEAIITVDRRSTSPSLLRLPLGA